MAAEAEEVSEADIHRRNGGCGVVVDGKLYVWGGEGSEKRLVPPDNSDSEEDSDAEEKPMEVVWKVTTLPPPRQKCPAFDVYDLQQCKWSRQPTSGDAPLLGLGSSLNVHHDTRTVYLFGGWNAGLFDANVYRIGLDEWRWEKVQLKGEMRPSGRYLTGVLIHKSRLCVLGGVGPDIHADHDPEAKYIPAPTAPNMAFGWNNQYYEFDMESDQWSAPLGKDPERPEPLGAHCFVKFDLHRAVLFGGKYESGRRNELRFFDLEKRKFSKVQEFFRLPIGRVFATLTTLVDPSLIGQRLCGCGPILEQRLLLLWGKNLDDVITTETWILDTAQLTWTELQIDMYPRSWHIAAPLYSSQSTECQVAIFGGNVHSEGYTGRRRNTADIKILSFGVRALSWLCLQVLVRETMAASVLPPFSQLSRQIRRAAELLTNNHRYPAITNRQPL